MQTQGITFFGVQKPIFVLHFLLSKTASGTGFSTPSRLKDLFLAAGATPIAPAETAMTLRFAALYLFDDTNQQIDFLISIVKRQRRTHGAFQAETAQDRLRAMMAGAHSDTCAV